jgi:hypothetical protein
MPIVSSVCFRYFWASFTVIRKMFLYSIRENTVRLFQFHTVSKYYTILSRLHSSSFLSTKWDLVAFQCNPQLWHNRLFPLLPQNLTLGFLKSYKWDTLLNLIWYFLRRVLGFELRASHLQSRHSTACDTLLVHRHLRIQENAWLYIPPSLSSYVWNFLKLKKVEAIVFGLSYGKPLLS